MGAQISAMMREENSHRKCIADAALDKIFLPVGPIIEITRDVRQMLEDRIAQWYDSDWT